MQAPFFSVVVPVYNAEKYIDRCIKSVLTQTYENVQLVLVNDGSTDDSGKICDKYAERYSNVCVIHKKNGGTSSAKNRGIDYVKNGYVALLDSDDFIDNDLFESVSKIIVHNNPDCIDFGFRYVNRHGEKTENLHKISKNILLNKDFIRERMIPPLLNLEKSEETFIFDFAVNKIYKKDILDKYGIRFCEERTTWEDRPFVLDYISHCDTYYCLDKCFYNYIDIPNSLSRRYTNVYFDAVLENYINYRYKFGKQYNFETQYVYRYWCNSLENIILWSLNQKEVPLEEVKSKIDEILTNQETVALYKKRVSINKQEKTISNLVLEGKIDDVIRFYTKKIIKDECKNKYKGYLAKIKSIIGKC